MDNKKWYQRPFLWLFLFVLVSVPAELWIALPKAKVDKFFSEIPRLIEENVLAKYPDDLEINIDKGRVKLNRPLPYCLVIAEEADGKKTGVVFDESPKASLLMQEENKYSGLCKAVGLVGENYVIFPDDDGFKVQEIPSELNFGINKDQLTSVVDKYLPIIKKWGLLAYEVGPFVLVPVVMLAYLLKNVWYGLVVKLASKLFKVKKMSTGESYRTSLLVLVAWSAVKWLIKLAIAQTVNKTVSLSPFGLFDTMLITVISLYLIKGGVIDFAKKS